MSIANNKKAFHDYFIEDQLEAGLVLDGWEVKAVRAGRLQPGLIDNRGVLELAPQTGDAGLDLGDVVESSEGVDDALCLGHGAFLLIRPAAAGLDEQ